MNDIEIPEELLPSEDLIEYSKNTGDAYKEIYNGILSANGAGITPTDAIRVISMVQAEKVYCLIGDNLSDYDKKIICGVIERYVAATVFSE